MKRFFKVIAIFMVVILCFGALSTFFELGSDEPTGPGTIVDLPSGEDPACSHRDADDNNLCDLCGEAYSDGTDIEEPSCTHVDANDDKSCDKCGEAFSDGQDLFGGTTINNLTFSEIVYKDVLNGTERGSAQGYSLGGITPGFITTESGYLHYETRAEDLEEYSDKTSQIYFGIHNDTKQGFVQPVYKSTFEYMTIDFDVWSDTQYFSRMAFKLQGKDSEGNTVNEQTYYEIYRYEGRVYLAYYESNLIDICEIGDRVHLTFVISRVDSKIKLYVDGEYKHTNNYKSDMESLIYLRAYFGQGFVEEGCFVNFDNFTVSTFGEATGTYTGAIRSAYNDTSINLTECADSVLYNKNN